MKRLCICMLVLALFASCMLAFAGCELPFDKRINYNDDVVEVAANDIQLQHFVAKQNTVYYTSQKLSLWMKVNGALVQIPYFAMDGKVRIYSNLPLHQDDCFYMLTGDEAKRFASLGDLADTSYAMEEKLEGKPLQINVLQTGRYNLCFDVSTLCFDLEYLEELTTPLYYTIPSCHLLVEPSTFVPMEVNPLNTDELVATNVAVAANQVLSLWDADHLSAYKVVLHDDCNGTYATFTNNSIVVANEGYYNVYVNTKTYVVRMEPSTQQG